MDLEEYDKILKEYGDESDCFRDYIESDLVYVATFGLEDMLREEIVDSVQLIRKGYIMENEFEDDKNKDQVTVRMISGDHIETCRSIAVQAKIITD